MTLRGGSIIRVGILTPDMTLAKELRGDVSGFGFSVINKGDGTESADVVLLDCRGQGDASQDCDYPGYEQSIVAIVETRPDLDVDVLLEANDIIFYPYSKDELYVRIMLAAARNQPEQSSDVFSWDGFSIDFSNYEVLIDGTKLDLTYKEYELLKHLASAPGRVFTRSQLLKSVWGYDYIEGARTVDVHIRRLRSKLGTKHANLIETVRHVGYRFRRIPL